MSDSEDRLHADRAVVLLAVADDLVRSIDAATRAEIDQAAAARAAILTAQGAVKRLRELREGL